jgi:hypothetical protein
MMVAQRQRETNQQRNDASQRGSNLGDGSSHLIPGLTHEHALFVLDEAGDVIMGEEVD